MKIKRILRPLWTEQVFEDVESGMILCMLPKKEKEETVSFLGITGGVITVNADEIEILD